MCPNSRSCGNNEFKEEIAVVPRNMMDNYIIVAVSIDMTKVPGLQAVKETTPKRLLFTSGMQERTKEVMAVQTRSMSKAVAEEGELEEIVEFEVEIGENNDVEVKSGSEVVV